VEAQRREASHEVTPSVGPLLLTQMDVDAGLIAPDQSSPAEEGPACLLLD
jgi:hypothetical protein